MGNQLFARKPLNMLLALFFRGFNATFRRATNAYTGGVGKVLHFSSVALVIYAGLIVLTYFGFITTARGFIRSSARNARETHASSAAPGDSASQNVSACSPAIETRYTSRGRGSSVPGTTSRASSKPSSASVSRAGRPRSAS